MVKSKIAKFLHLQGLKIYLCLYLVNRVYVGPRCYEKKRKLLNTIGHEIGENTKVVGPVECSGKLITGKNCWIGKNFKINGNGTVTIGDNCDIAPEVTFQTGSHEIGDSERRAGPGYNVDQSVGEGTWVGVRVTVLNKTRIGSSCIIAGCSCVTEDVEDSSLVGGVPAKLIRRLENA